MDDLISRKAAIDAIKGLPTWWADDGGYYDGAQPPMEALLEPNDVISAIDNLPSAQQWIPCSERLPDSQEDVLCDEDGHVILGFYTDEEIGWHDTHSYRIYPTAWMPLPSPYREEVSD